MSSPWSGRGYFVGLALLVITIVVTLRATHIDHIVMAAAAALAWLYTTRCWWRWPPARSVPTAFVHRGFAASMAAMHRLPTLEDARCWAGFFSLAAHIQEAGGFADLTDVLFWAPVVFGPLMCFGLRHRLGDRRQRPDRVAVSRALPGIQLVSAGLFRPQAVAGLGYVAILGTLLWQLRRAPLPTAAGVDRILPGRLGAALSVGRRTPGRVPGFGPGRTLAVGATLLLIITANTVSHQMTPMLTVLALAAFAVTGTTRYRTLWIAAGLVFAAWFSYGATDFWTTPQLALQRGRSDRLLGQPGCRAAPQRRPDLHDHAVSTNRSLRALRRRGVHRLAQVPAPPHLADLGFAVPAPFVLVALQNYGGEMIIRVFLFASPTLAPFVALVLVWASRSLRRPPTVAVTLLAIALALGVGVLETTNRGLNAAFESSTKAEDILTQGLINKIPPRSSVMVFSHAAHAVVPRRSMDPNAPTIGYIDSFPCLDNLAQCTENRRPDYVLITHQGIAMMDLQRGKPTAEMEIRRR